MMKERSEDDMSSLSCSEDEVDVIGRKKSRSQFKKRNMETRVLFDDLPPSAEDDKDGNDNDNYHDNNPTERMGNFKLKYPLSNDNRTVRILFIRVRRVVHVCLKIVLRDTNIMTYVNRMSIIRMMLGSCWSPDMKSKMAARYDNRYDTGCMMDDIFDHFRHDEEITHKLKSIHRRLGHYNINFSSHNAIYYLSSDGSGISSENATKAHITNKKSVWKEVTNLVDTNTTEIDNRVAPVNAIVCAVSIRKSKNRKNEMFVALMRQKRNNSKEKDVFVLEPFDKDIQATDVMTALSRYKIFQVGDGSSSSTCLGEVMARYIDNKRALDVNSNTVPFSKEEKIEAPQYKCGISSTPFVPVHPHDVRMDTSKKRKTCDREDEDEEIREIVSLRDLSGHRGELEQCAQKLFSSVSRSFA